MKLAAFLLFLFFVSRLAHSEEVIELCNIRLQSEKEVDFTDIEKKWLCGDPESQAWRVIPVAQKKTWLTSFLQDRGYHQLKFEEKEGKLIVTTGPLYRVERFTVEGAPPEWNWAKRRKVIGSVLDPKILDENASWAQRELSYRGYPCPKVTAEAFLDEKELLLQASPGPKQKFGEVQNEGFTDLDQRILERYMAFKPGQDFDLRLLELTSQRILREDLYLSTYYDAVCNEKQQARIVRRFVPAAPRLLTFGAGFDTESGVIGRIHWKRTRLTKKADSIESTAYLSFREQKIDVQYRNHFPSDLSSRWEFDPTITVDRVDEKKFESITYQGDIPLATTYELPSFQIATKFGPRYTRIDTRRSVIDGPKHLDLLRLAGSLSFQSHLFEYYASNPRNGWRVTLEGWSQPGGIFSPRTIHRASIQQEVLWNLGNLEPPLFVLGWRGFQGSYFFRIGANLNQDIPVSERFFLGGDEDIRGFGRKQLPSHGNGYLTALYEGFELRIVDWLPYGFQPLVFFDLAKAGENAEVLDAPLYYAPGFGVRWASPIGTLRGSLAKGYVTGDQQNPGWQFFVSLGREF